MACGPIVASATVRTWPGTSDSLTFFVIGDFGTGDKVQMDLAARMEAERKARENSASPVRFVISTGDNIYGQFSGSGADDRDWDKKFFIPYEPILRTIPFKAVLGNHDGNESERTGDLATCLDNFFMPARWYQFSYGAFAEFIALDTTRNQPTGRKAPLYLPGGDQSRWLTEALARPPAPWRFVIMHHPMFTAGPRHKPFLLKAPHWMQALREGHVQAVFSGHEHTLQFSEQAEATGNMLFVVSGAGGELRPESVTKRMRSRHIAAWGNQNHFLIVTITGNQLSVEPIGVQPVFLRDSSEKPAPSTVRSRSK